MLTKAKCLFLILLFTIPFHACRMIKIETICFKDIEESSVQLKRKILIKIDSVYSATPKINFKKIIKSKCINDTLIEVRVMNSLYIYDVFCFNNKIHLIEIKHELEEVH
jgi:hypothetical protein